MVQITPQCVTDGATFLLVLAGSNGPTSAPADHYSPNIEARALEQQDVAARPAWSNLDMPGRRRAPRLGHISVIAKGAMTFHCYPSPDVPQTCLIFVLWSLIQTQEHLPAALCELKIGLMCNLNVTTAELDDVELSF